MAKGSFIAFILVFLSLSSAVPTRVGAQQTRCSTNGSASATITFVNTAPYSVSLFWVNYQCQEVFYAAIPSGYSATQQTFVGHPWHIRKTQDGSLLQEIIAVNSTPFTVSITGGVRGANSGSVVEVGTRDSRVGPNNQTVSILPDPNLSPIDGSVVLQTYFTPNPYPISLSDSSAYPNFDWRYLGGINAGDCPATRSSMYTSLQPIYRIDWKGDAIPLHFSL